MSERKPLITPKQFFVKKWKVKDVEVGDVHKGQRFKFSEKEGEWSLTFPDGKQNFGDGRWDQYEDLTYHAKGDAGALEGTVSCRFPKHAAGPVTATFSKESETELRCGLVLDLEPGGMWEDPGEWTAEEEPDPEPGDCG